MLTDNLSQIKAEDTKWKIPILGMSVLELVFLVGLVAFIRIFVFQPFQVSGPSMCPTLNQLEGTCEFGRGEIVFVNQLSYSFFRSPERGEVVVFRSPVEDIFVIKRVIGVPGDAVRVEGGAVYVTPEGESEYAVDEFYLNEQNAGSVRTSGVTQFQVGEGRYFLMGDNRKYSKDGRHCYRSGNCPNPTGSYAYTDDAATIAEDQILGVAEVVLFPFSSWRRLQ